MGFWSLKKDHWTGWTLIYRHLVFMEAGFGCWYFCNRITLLELLPIIRIIDLQVIMTILFNWF